MPETISVIAIGDDGWTNLSAALPAERMTSAYGFHKPWWRGVSFFHRDGTRFEIEKAIPARPLPKWSKLMAATIFNPTFNTRYEFRAAGRYSLPDLKKALAGAIERDRGLLTQFHDAGELLARVERAASFDDVVAVLDYAGKEDEG